MRICNPYMGHAAPHSCADLSVYCYLPNSLLIATLLLPVYKLALLFSVLPPLFSQSLLFSPPFSTTLGFFRSARVALLFCFGSTGIAAWLSVNRIHKGEMQHVLQTRSSTRHKALSFSSRLCQSGDLRPSYICYLTGRSFTDPHSQPASGCCCIFYLSPCSHPLHSWSS